MIIHVFSEMQATIISMRAGLIEATHRKSNFWIESAMELEEAFRHQTLLLAIASPHKASPPLYLMRTNIVNETDLKQAAEQQEKYLDSITGTILGTIQDFESEK